MHSKEKGRGRKLLLRHCCLSLLFPLPFAFAFGLPFPSSLSPLSLPLSNFPPHFPLPFPSSPDGRPGFGQGVCRCRAGHGGRHARRAMRLDGVRHAWDDETITRHAHRITDAQVQGLREAGWSDAQIAEAVHVAAFFALCTRLADAFDIKPPAMMDREGVPAALERPP